MPKTVKEDWNTVATKLAERGSCSGQLKPAMPARSIFGEIWYCSTCKISKRCSDDAGKKRGWC